MCMSWIRVLSRIILLCQHSLHQTVLIPPLSYSTLLYTTLLCTSQHTILPQVEGEIGEQIALANFKISDLKSRLVHTAAEIEHIVNIERTTFRALHLKTMIRQR